MLAKLIVGLLYQIPEGFLVIFTGLGLVGIVQPRRRIFLSGLIFGIATIMLRSFNVPLGLHTTVSWLIACVLMKYGGKVSLPTAAVGSILAFFAISLGEQILVFPLMSTWKIAFAGIYQNPWQMVLWGWLSSTFLVLGAAAVRNGFVLIPALDRSQKVK